jgi:hypothetical protein
MLRSGSTRRALVRAGAACAPLSASSSPGSIDALHSEFKTLFVERLRFDCDLPCSMISGILAQRDVYVDHVTLIGIEGVPSIKTLMQRIEVCEQPFRVLVSASHGAPQPLSCCSQISTVLGATPNVLRRPQKAARADARLERLSRVPARRGAAPRAGRPSGSRRPGLRAEARLPAIPARASPIDTETVRRAIGSTTCRYKMLVDVTP